MITKAELEQLLKSNGVDIASLALLSDVDRETMYSLTTGGSEAVSLWQTLRGLVEQTGFWPVIVGDGESVRFHTDSIEQAKGISAGEIIQAGLQIDPVACL